MFDMKNLGDLSGLMENARKMQDQAKAMQEELARKQVTADAGGGMVLATVNGRLELVKLKIDKTKIDLADTEMLEDVIVAAVSAAQAKASDTARQEMAKFAQSMGLPPGLMP